MNELAKYGMDMYIEGMQVDGMPAGAGDRRLSFEASFDASDDEMANALWYEHLSLMFGDGQVEKLREFAGQMQRKR